MRTFKIASACPKSDAGVYLLKKYAKDVEFCEDAADQISFCEDKALLGDDFRIEKMPILR